MPARSDLAEVIAAARQAAARAYAPYSGFRVGAALRTADGSIFAGCNVENASYGLTICAERNAIGQMIAAGQPRFETIVVYTPTATPTAPCGACRQVLFEFNPEAQIVMVCDGPAVSEGRVGDLLPEAFGPAMLGRTDQAPSA